MQLRIVVFNALYWYRNFRLFHFCSSQILNKCSTYPASTIKPPQNPPIEHCSLRPQIFRFIFVMSNDVVSFTPRIPRPLFDLNEMPEDEVLSASLRNDVETSQNIQGFGKLDLCVHGEEPDIRNSSIEAATIKSSSKKWSKSSSARNWLPDDWVFLPKVRTGGKTAGRTDKYYVAPTGLKFRSKIEVMHYLETGKKQKRKLTPEADAGSSGTTSNGKQKKSSVRRKSSSPLKSDNNVASTTCS